MGRVYLCVLFEQKDDVKVLGAQWDRVERRWFIPDGLDPEPFTRWIIEADCDVEAKPNAQRWRYLTLPPVDDEEFKRRNTSLTAMGARFDSVAKRWYVPPGIDHSPFRKWLNEISAIPLRTPARDDVGRYLAYAFDALQRSDLDKLVNDTFSVAVDFEELRDGALREAPSKEFWDELACADEDARAVFIVFGYSWPSIRGKHQWKILLAVPAVLQESGKFLPVYEQLPLFNMSFFEPQETNRRPVLGSIADMESTLRATSAFEKGDWGAYWEWLNTLFETVNKSAASPGSDVTAFQDDDGCGMRACVVPYERNDAIISNLRRLYAAVSQTDPKQIALLRSVCSKPAEQLPPLPQPDARALAQRHTGHMSNEFGLDATQRSALAHLLATPDGRTLAVSGPPGTGKTALMQGVIATLLVNKTLSSAHPQPPIIIASSATNQAVTNVIKAFSGIAAPYEECSIASRWIPQVFSYGWFFPSRAAANEPANAAFQLLMRERHWNCWSLAGTTKGFEELLRSSHAFSFLRGEFLDRCRRVFPDVHVSSMAEAANILHRMLAATASGTEQNSTSALGHALGAIASLDAFVGTASLDERRLARSKLMRKAGRHSRLDMKRAFLASQVEETHGRLLHAKSRAFLMPQGRSRPIFWTLIENIHKRETWIYVLDILRERLRADTSPISGVPAPTMSLDFMKLEQEHAQALARLERFNRRDERIRERERFLHSLVDGITEIETLVASLENIATTYLPDTRARPWITGLRAGLCGNVSTTEEQRDYMQGAAIGRLIEAPQIGLDTLYDLLDAFLDRTIRSRCFHLACRYWEARWLMEAQTTLHDEGESAVIAAVRQHCMLAPVIVGTAYQLPNLLLVKGIDEKPNSYAFSAADLLIIDEAGQVSPPVAVSLFALAKRCITVGDVEQLAPIASLATSQDIGLLRLHGLADDIARLTGAGLSAAKGSIMRAAQTTSAFSDADGRGITLVRHYRCRPTIIQFCNELVYRKSQPLIPVTQENPQRIYHPMSYVEIETPSVRPPEGSLKNVGEAEAIIAWLLSERERIERHYNWSKDDAAPILADDPRYRDIRSLVALISPYLAQKKLLEKLVRETFTFNAARTRSNMVIGTVHALQGAERPIVVFSPVSTPKDENAPFMDMATDMLNVAVSRAQDTFILFGHRDLFFSPRALSASNVAPSAMLGRYMRRWGRHLYPRKLVVVESPGKVAAMQATLGKDCAVVATRGHFRNIAAVDLAALTARWEVSANKAAGIAHAVELLNDMDELIIATDDDSEGDAIGWHVIDELRARRPMDSITISRMLFGEVTEIDVARGFTQRVAPWTGSRRAVAATTRAVIDKFYGDALSAELSKRMNQRGLGGNHAMGRVRAALFELIALHQELETPRENWRVRATLRAGAEALTAYVTEGETYAEPMRFSSREDAENAACALEHDTLAWSLEQQRFSLGAATPSSTVTVLIRAWEELGMRPPRTMQILRHLYEGSQHG